MTNPLARLSLRSRVFLATSISITALFAIAGWGLERYAVHVATENVRAEIRASVQAYESIWTARTRVLSATTALMSAMSEVRAAFLTRNQQTIRDSAEELWSRISDESALFLVLSPEGQLISSLGPNGAAFPVSAVPVTQVASRFPSQLAGYVNAGAQLFYVVLTPVYVQARGGPLLLNVLCAGFRIDNNVVAKLKQSAPGSEFAFVGRNGVFASTIGSAPPGSPLAQALLRSGSEEHGDRFIVFRQGLPDIGGRPVAELRILRSIENVRSSLGELGRVLGLTWILTIALALLISSYATRRLLEPVQLLDRAATEVARGNNQVRVPVSGSDELSRLAATFNAMCESLERAREDLIRQEQIQTVGRLGTSLVHDLRNPLAAIYGGAEMLVDGRLPPEQTRRVALNVHRASQRLQELLRDLMHVSRGGPPVLEVCRLHEIIGAAVDAVPRLGREVRLEMDVGDDLEVVADRNRLERVFSNLLGNAVEAMADSGTVRITASDQPNNIDVLVEDNGPGIPAWVREQLFRPFVTSKRSGLGLGLTLSRQTMLDLGGDLLLMNGNGAGACFCVRLKKPRHEPVLKPAAGQVSR